ncbi:hypothetical protein AK812_SmicGene39062 [Symbiodinium microadriaticum]|uniref:HMG box domain-containing protein n=1 Tax=Symbiodinium microadriaticum TaxID=2951 RepID=A0A1Q9CC57_SYMMI|nr:hypothetical protein AK812_SmicGene39062 [Symbiodinium microadriaticum]
MQIIAQRAIGSAEEGDSKMPPQERDRRLCDQRKRLSGLLIKHATEPALMLVDKFVKMARDACLSYVPLSACASREDEMSCAKPDKKLLSMEHPHDRVQSKGAAAVPAAEPLSPVKGKAPKRKVEELEKSLQRKCGLLQPSFAEISKAIPERWKSADEAEKAVYEQKAKIAKEQLALEPAEEAAAKPKKAEAKKPAAKKGKGKGKGKNAEESRALAAPMDLVARTFKSGGAGWFSSVKFELPVGSQQVSVQAQVVMNVSGSKYWEDGEGLEAALKALDGKAQQAAAKHDDANAALEEAPCTPKRRGPRSLMQAGAAVPDEGMPDAPEVHAEAEAAGVAVPDEGVPDAPEVHAEEAVAAGPDEGMPDAPEVHAEAEAAGVAVPDEGVPDASEVHAEAEAVAAAEPDEGVPDAPEVHAEVQETST